WSRVAQLAERRPHTGAGTPSRAGCSGGVVMSGAGARAKPLRRSPAPAQGRGTTQARSALHAIQSALDAGLAFLHGAAHCAGPVRGIHTRIARPSRLSHWK